MSNRGLLRQTKAWCPLCLAELNKNNLVFEKLVWSLKNYAVCSKHHIELHSICWKCKSHQLYLNDKIKPGICYKCGAFLGEDNVLGSDLCRDTARLKQSKSIEKLISSMQDYQKSFTQKRLTEILTLCNAYLKQNFKGHPILQVLKSKLSWLRTRHGPPCLGFLLEVAAAVSIDLADLFITPIEMLGIYNKEALLAPPIIRAKHYRTPRQPIYDRKLTESRLKGYLKLPIPYSFQAISREIGQHPNTLLKNYPDLSRKLINRYRIWLLDIKRQKIRNVYKEVRETINFLRKQGVHPTRVAVQNNISNPILFRQALYRKAYLDIIAGIDIESCDVTHDNREELD